MTFDEVCFIAGTEKELPAFALPYERIACIGLAWLYHSYRRGFLSKEEAAREKETMRNEYENAQKKEKDDMESRRCADHIRVAFGGQFKKVEQSGCPVCKNLVRILDGRDSGESQDT